MLTTNSIARTVLLKKCCLAPLALVAILMFSKNTIAKDLTDTMDKAQKEAPAHQDDSEELQTAFDEILAKYIKPNKRNSTSLWMNFSDADSEQMIAIYQKMSPSQQSKQIVQYGTGAPLEKKIPTKEEFEKWKDAKVYGVWLDEKRISNDELNNYTSTDFSHYFISGLTKTATNYGKHDFQVNLSTNEHFAAYNHEITTEPEWMPNMSLK